MASGVTAERARRERGAERVLDVEAAAELEVDPASTDASAASKVIASGSSSASRLPYSSPALRTATGSGSARKSRRFASKYVSMSPWKSR